MVIRYRKERTTSRPFPCLLSDSLPTVVNTCSPAVFTGGELAPIVLLLLLLLLSVLL